MPGERMVMVIAVSGMLLGCETSGPTNCNGQPSSDEVCIMGGSFLMGHPTISDRPGDSPFAPVHEVTLSPFFIDIDPISNGQYKACFDAGACPDEPPCPDPCIVPFQAAYSIHDPALADYPMATATVDGAEAYCLFAGKRLPTEAEWERAARGSAELRLPVGQHAARLRGAALRSAVVRSGLSSFPGKLSRRPGDRRRIPGGRAGDVDDGPPPHGGRAPTLLDGARHQPTRSHRPESSERRAEIFIFTAASARPTTVSRTRCRPGNARPTPWEAFAALVPGQNHRWRRRKRAAASTVGVNQGLTSQNGCGVPGKTTISESIPSARRRSRISVRPGKSVTDRCC